MSPSVATRTWGRPSPVDLSHRRPLAILVAVGLVVAIAVLPRLAPPAKAPPLTITNGGDYTVTIEASNGAGDGWTPVAVVDANGTVRAEELIDRGDTWTLRFTSQGHQIGTYHVDRADLAANGWQYTVPPDVALRLGELGAPPTP